MLTFTAQVSSDESASAIAATKTMTFGELAQSELHFSAAYVRCCVFAAAVHCCLFAAAMNCCCALPLCLLLRAVAAV